jgi:predicted PurR-regulated permease PerM
LGVLVGSGLWFIGVPNPVLWGILTMLLRFVPYIGPVIAAAFPAALAVAVDPGWSMLFWVVGLFLVAEGTTGQVIEPWLYGRSTGLSGVAVVVAAAFWTLLWGPVGLLLATPLTMCLVVLGRHVDHLQFLDVLLGDRPALAPEESFYQRMLADDPDEAAHQA